MVRGSDELEQVSQHGIYACEQYGWVRVWVCGCVGVWVCGCVGVCVCVCVCVCVVSCTVNLFLMYSYTENVALGSPSLMLESSIRFSSLGVP